MQTELPDWVVWKLNKSGYGLYDAGETGIWKFCEKLVSLRCKPTIGDEALFYYRKKDSIIGMVSIQIHVDDFNAVGTEDFKKDIMD